MATTRMKVSSNATVFHRVATANDMPQHDIGTSDGAVSGLGGSADFQIDSDENTTYSTAHKQQGAGSEAAIGSGAISQFIHIKHTGFQEASKTNTTTSNLTVGIGGTFASAGGFTLASGEAITLHGLGGGSDNLSEIQLDSSSGNIYVEVVYL
jgi:hypothetical protein